MVEGIVVVLSGPSGVGKGTVCRYLLQHKPELQLSVSMTTRPPRPGELDGREYYFTTPERFVEMIDRGSFLEWARLHGHFYGTPRAAVESSLSAGRDIVLEIDVQGAKQVREKLPQAVLVFLAPPSRLELERRIAGRGTEEPELIADRLETARREMALYTEYDYLVINDRVEQAAALIDAVITAEKCRVSRGARPAEWR